VGASDACHCRDEKVIRTRQVYRYGVPAGTVGVERRGAFYRRCSKPPTPNTGLGIERFVVTLKWRLVADLE
jgi:hypothetical protein